MNKLKLVYLIFSFTVLLLQACGNDDILDDGNCAYVKPPIISNNTQPQKKEESRYVYKGDRSKDPFIAISGESAVSTISGDVVVPAVGGLTLKGILNDGKNALAIIAGNGVTYTLKHGKLYDNRQRIIKGFSGIISSDKVIIRGQDNTTKELRLREKR